MSITVTSGWFDYYHLQKDMWCIVSLKGRVLWARLSEECLSSANQNIDVLSVGGASPPTPFSPSCSMLLFKFRSQTVGRRLSRGSRLLYTVNVLVKRWQQQYFSLGAFTFMYFLTITAIFGNKTYCRTLVVWSSSNRTARCIERRRELFFFLNPFSVGFAGVLLLSCTVPRHFL